MSALQAELRALWAASSIAVIGATERSGAIGRLPIEYLQRYGFAGTIYPINPKGGTVLGIPAYRSLAQVPGPIDLALVMVPASAVRDAVSDCAAADVPVCVVMSSGFAEAGSAGEAAQRELVDIARRSGMRLVGPNCIGAVGGESRVLATFSPVFSSPTTPLPAGRLGLVSQSGALGFGTLSLGLERGVPIGIAVTTGNEADVTATDVAEALSTEDSIDALLMYVESLSDIDALRTAATRVPIAMVKAGRSAAGASAAASHTGALAAPDAVVDTALASAGIARVRDIDALLDAGALMATGGVLRDARVAVITTSGGSGILAADAIEREGLTLAELDASTVRDLEAIVPVYGNATNPVDVTAAVMAEPGLFEQCLERLARDPHVDAIVACFAVLVGDDVARIARALGAVRASAAIPVIAVRTGSAALAPEGARLLADAGIPVYPTPERAIAALAALRATSRGPRLRAKARHTTIPVPPAGASEKDLKEILGAHGLPVPESVLVTSADQARAALTRVGGRAVLKAVVPGLQHKSDAGGVVLDVDAEHIGDVFTRLSALGGDVLVERFVPGGIEVIVGVTPSPLGPVLTVGVGGVLTEVVADAAVRLLPVTDSDIDEMLDATVLGRLLGGVRGRPPADRAALVDVIARIADGVRAWPAGFELDLNPVTAVANGCWILDAMYASPQEGS